MKIATLFLTLFCFSFLANAQKTFTIRYTYKYSKEMSDSFMYKLVKPNAWLGMGETPFYNDK